MAYEKAQRLIEQLHKKTIEGDLDWEEGPDTESFQVNFSDYSITIESLSDLNATEEYQIVIRNSTGRVLERFSDLDIPRIGGGAAIKQSIRRNFRSSQEICPRH